TTAAGCKTDPLWTSSCSTTCDAAPFTSAAKYGVVNARLQKICDGPSDGPAAAAKRSIDATGAVPLPARADANQSRNSSLVFCTTSAGTSDSWKSARNWHSMRVVDSFTMLSDQNERGRPSTCSAT